jgi:ribonuclease R
MENDNGVLQDALRKILQGAPESGLTLQAMMNRLGASADESQVRTALKALTRAGDATRLAKSKWAGPPAVSTISAEPETTTPAAPPANPFQGLLVYQRERYLVQNQGQKVFIPDAELGAAVAGDRVHFGIERELSGGQAIGRILEIVVPVSRRFIGQLTPYEGHWVVNAPGVLEPMLFDAEGRDDVRPGQTIEMEIGGRIPRPRASGVFPPQVLHATSVEAEPRFDIDPRSVFPQIDQKLRNATQVLDDLVRAIGVDTPWTDEILEQVSYAREPGEPEGDEWDLRLVPLVTIDGATAKDFDDAVYAERIGKRIRLLVAIADVSSYVESDSVLDREARLRGCSVYLPGRVYPMLPSRLSDDLCSLRPGVPRRCAWVSMMIEPDGRIDDYALGFGVMCSWARLTYEDVKDYIGGKAFPASVPDDVNASIDTLDDAWRRLLKHRRSRGMLDLDRPEPVITLSEDGSRVVTVEAHPRWESHRMIEECMVATNEVVARFLDRSGWPAPVRSHKDPDATKLSRVRDVTRGLGIDLKLSRTPKVEELSAILARLQGTPLSTVLSTLVLRSLPRAEYSIDNAGHYGIGADHYLHFTSPIRRYPDLMVHRLIRLALAGRAPAPGKRLDRLRDALQVGVQCANNGEERAKKAERFAERALRARMMLDHVGDELEGTITDMQHFGLFVQINEPFVDGMIPTRKLGRDYFEFVEGQLQMRGRRTGQVFRLGDRLRVRVADVDLKDSRIRFELLEHLGGPGELPAAAEAPRPKRRGGKSDATESSRRRSRSKSDQPKAEQPKEQQAKSGQPQSNKAQSNKAQSNKAQSNKAQANQPKANQPKSNKPSTDAPAKAAVSPADESGDTKQRRSRVRPGAAAKRARAGDGQTSEPTPAKGSPKGAAKAPAQKPVKADDTGAAKDPGSSRRRRRR